MPPANHLFLACVLLMVLWLAHEPLLALWNLISNREAVSGYLQGFGMWGPFVLVISLGLQVILVIIPGHLLLITSGYVYGFSTGFLLNLIAAVGASQLVFIFARRAGPALVSRWIPAPILNRWNQVRGSQGFAFFLFFFWFPVIPSNFMNFVAGVSPISSWQFLAANLLGRVPAVALLTFVGSHGFELTFKGWLLVALGLLCLFLVGRYISSKIIRFIAH